MSSLSRRELKRLASLQTKKYRQREGQCVLEGLRLCQDALRSDWTLRNLFATPEFAGRFEDTALFTAARQRNLEVSIIPAADLDRITGTQTAQGVAVLADLPAARQFRPGEPDLTPVLLLDAISDPGNLGTLIRSADWFGVPDIVLGPGTVEWSNPKVMRSTMGSVFRVRLFDTGDWNVTLRSLRDAGYRILAADLHGRPLREYASDPGDSPWALLLGNEAQGISPSLSSSADTVYTITGTGETDSLNVAMAGTVFLYEFNRN